MLNLQCRLPTSRSLPTVDAEVNEERGRKRKLAEQSISLYHEDSKVVDFHFIRSKSKFWYSLPIMTESQIEKGNWSILKNYSLPADYKVNIKEALESELVAMCVWCLSLECPPHDLKVHAICVLTCICFGAREARNVPAVDQVPVEKLVLRVLKECIVGLQRHVCFALSYIACCSGAHLNLISNDGIQDQLIELARGPRSSLTFAVLRAIGCIAMVNQGMREKIVGSELSDSWFGTLMVSESNDSILEEACMIVACIACRRDSERLWDQVTSFYMPAIATKCCRSFVPDVDLLRAAAFALMKITEYASPRQIMYLVIEADCIEVLFEFTESILEDNDGLIFRWFLGAIDNILRAWDGPSFENWYAERIDHIYMGWEALLVVVDFKNIDRKSARLARGLVLQYRPHLLDDSSMINDTSSTDEDEDEDEEVSYHP